MPNNQSGYRSAIIAVVVMLLCAGCGGERADRRGPVPIADVVEAVEGKNLLIVLLDATAAEHMGCYGYGRDTTPELDRVAAESVLFENVYAQSSGTMLSVFSFFTSRYPIFGDAFKVDQKTVVIIPEQRTTVAEHLAVRYPARLGYTSNTWLKKKFGHGQGFTDYWELRDLQGGRLATGADDEHALPLCLDWMKANADRGFFAYLHLMKPHGPYDEPEPFFSRFTEREVARETGTHAFLQGLKGRYPGDETAADVRAIYDGNLAFIDHEVGAMIDGLREAGLWDETVFVLMSDHGQSLYEHGHPHGHGGIVWENALRVPLFIRIPGEPRLAGRRVSDPVELVDLLPTLLELTGLPPATDDAAGRSLAPLIAGRAGADEEAGAGRILHSRTNRRDPPIYCVLSGNGKLILWEGDRPRRALFDLAADPAESRNLLEEDPENEAGQRLARYLESWLATGGEDGSLAGSLPLEVMDEKDIRRLRSLGYVQ